MLPNTTFPSRQNNRKPVFAEVRGDFQHSKELTRVHNTICCLTRQFDLIVHHSLRGSNNTNGCTSFRNMHFVETKFSDEVVGDDISKGNLLRQLEHISWVYFEYLQESTNDVTMTRKKWRYINELEVSNTKEGDPNWVIESIAQCDFSSLLLISLLYIILVSQHYYFNIHVSSKQIALFIPMSFPSLPSSLTFENTPELLLDLKEKFEKGEISLEKTELAIIAVILEAVENEKDFICS